MTSCLYGIAYLYAMAAVIVHGGSFVGETISSVGETKVEGCQRAAKEAHKALMEGKSALDAVELAVRFLEDNPTFNAGHGSVLNDAGQVEMEVMIMDGRTLNYGSVAGVKNISNPVSLARMVMEKTDHVMLIGEGANQFAREIGVPEIDPLKLVTERAQEMWKEYKQFGRVVSLINSSTASPHDEGHDTVGAVAIDLKGNLAAATSTGGIMLKKVGRVGDTPLPGCGGYCDNDIGGVSTTGHGESMAKVTIAQRALNLLQTEQGLTLEGALEKALEYMWKRVKGRGGMIMISKDGEIAKCFTTDCMYWASVNKIGALESGLRGSLHV